jgi:hypothetical protein
MPAISSSSHRVSSCRTEASTASLRGFGSERLPAEVRPTLPLPRAPGMGRDGSGALRRTAGEQTQDLLGHSRLEFLVLPS